MKTFNEEFNYFKLNHTLNKMYLSNTFSAKKNKISIFWLVPLVVIYVICLFMPYNYLLGILIVICLFLLSLYIKYTVAARNELTNNNLPVPKSIFKWKTDELEDLRINHLFIVYENINSNIIKERIEIAKKRINIIDKDVFTEFEKIVEFFGKNYIILIIGIFIGLFNKSQFSEENFKILNMLILGILLISFFLTLSWKYCLKDSLNSSSITKKEQYLDYIYVMENILLMRL